MVPGSQQEIVMEKRTRLDIAPHSSERENTRRKATSHLWFEISLCFMMQSSRSQAATASQQSSSSSRATAEYSQKRSRRPADRRAECLGEKPVSGTIPCPKNEWCPRGTRRDWRADIHACTAAAAAAAAASTSPPSLCCSRLLVDVW